MKTITMHIDEAVLSRAENKAAALDTSVDDVVAEYLRQWADTDTVTQSRSAMAEKFAQPDWTFSVGTPDNREQRNART